ncbi:metalloproteinase inhibitor 2-like [Festucalex cinctus]
MMGWTVKSFMLPLVLLCSWWLEEGTQACSCVPRHPQQVFCQADVVIRALVVRRKADYDGYKPVKYVIKQTKMFKGPKRDFDAIYTESNSAACGVALETSVTYLLMGRLELDGSLHITLCDFFQPWMSLSFPRRNLLRRYRLGCSCKITRCTSLPCGISSPAECLWTDFLPVKMASGEQAQNFACIKRSYGYCAWYRGARSSKNFFRGIKQ